MSLDVTDEQIIALHNMKSLTIEQIAEGLGLEVEAVKFCLNKHNLLPTVKTVPEFGMAAIAQPVFSEQDVEMAKCAIRELSQKSDADSVRLKAAVFIINEAKGRNDVKALVEGVSSNIAAFNEAVVRARENMAKTRQLAEEKKKAINV